ncbi:N-acetylmuramoyl-L-alanine amidase [Nannocystaceae bacterium ST9]
MVPLAFALPSIALAGNPGSIDYGPEDTHQRPDDHEAQSSEYAPPLYAEAAEYPLAVAFNPASPSNYTSGGMISYDYVVVHTMQGSYEGSQSWFQNPDAQVSAHFCMRSEDGETTQMVHLSDRAWHVGSSNPYAIGIEHEGFVEEPAWYTWAMYQSSAQLARWIADDLGIPLDRDHVVGHVELPNQSHSDPGMYWNWDLYMALIHDVVPQGWVEGWVVDRGGCTVTTTSDTWFKKTLEQSDALADTDKCFVPAGTAVDYLHASGEMMGHYRLDYEAAAGPCEGFVDLDTQAFVFADHLSATCPNEDKAAAGVTVVLDGTTQAQVNPDGYFSFGEVGPGPHTIDVVGNRVYVDTTEPFDVDVYPGARLIIGVDPLDTPGDGDGDTTEGGECWIGGPGCECTPGGGCDPGLTCDAGICVPEGADETGGDSDGSASADEVGDSDGAGIDYLEADSCAVDQRAQGRGAWLGLALLGLAGLRRRRAA